MPKISTKGQLMPESPIRKLVPYSEEAIKKGKKVYHLNIGQPDIRTPEVALEAIKKADISTLDTMIQNGIRLLRKGDYHESKKRLRSTIKNLEERIEDFSYQL